jgi:hypothetical protein
VGRGIAKITILQITVTSKESLFKPQYHSRQWPWLSGDLASTITALSEETLVSGSLVLNLFSGANRKKKE